MDDFLFGYHPDRIWVYYAFRASISLPSRYYAFRASISLPNIIIFYTSTSSPEMILPYNWIDKNHRSPSNYPLVGRLSIILHLPPELLREVVDTCVLTLVN